MLYTWNLYNIVIQLHFNFFWKAELITIESKRVWPFDLKKKKTFLFCNNFRFTVELQS